MRRFVLGGAGQLFGSAHLGPQGVLIADRRIAFRHCRRQGFLLFKGFCFCRRGTGLRKGCCCGLGLGLFDHLDRHDGARPCAERCIQREEWQRLVRAQFLGGEGKE